MSTPNVPAAVIEILRAAGWNEGKRDENRARDLILGVAAHATGDGQLHQVVPPALDVLAEYGGLHLVPSADGEEVAASEILFDPGKARPTVRTLAALAEATGVPLTPVGVENDGTGIIAVDARGRLFVLDHTAEWYLGDTAVEAITTLLLGKMPRRVRQDGTW